MFDLSGRKALVTGASGGIGEEIARMLHAQGAVVGLHGTRVEKLEALANTLGERVQIFPANLSDRAEVKALGEKAEADLGGVDILVNNAGIARSDTPAEDTADEHWLNVLDVNLNGTFWCCRDFGRHMLAKGKGAIVNVGSMSGFIVNKPQPQSYYNASKAAVHHLTRSLAAEWGARGVRVNAVAPTYIDTPLNRFGMENPEMYKHWIGGTPMGRMGTIDEIGSVALFLASDASSLMTGAIVLADGGYTCW
jgi:NAD(P)-dependent dehydrogenase (short-subunit alcohol dehydrogenase family)